VAGINGARGRIVPTIRQTWVTGPIRYQTLAWSRSIETAAGNRRGDTFENENDQFRDN
jgi:hypothetical protein